MNRKIKKNKVTHKFLALNIPINIITNNNNNLQSQTLIENEPLGFDIEIFGDEGFHYKGTLTSYFGVVPNFMIPIKGDKKIFVNINYNFIENNNAKKFISFIEVPKRFQIDSTENTSFAND
jgi:hypothetical protein